MLTSPFDADGRDLAVLTTYFDPRGYKLPRQHYHQFAASLSLQRVPLFTVECAFDDRPFVLEGEHVYHIRASARCWQKERILNELERHVPAQYTKLAWIDADIVFRRRDWYDATRAALDTHVLAQLFDEYAWLDRAGQPPTVLESAALAGFAQKGGPYILTFDRHPGFAWAIRREVWQSLGGLFDIAGTTAGDSAMCCAALGLDTIFKMLAVGQTAMGRARYAAWRKAVCKKATWIPGRVEHLWHGNRNDRRYAAFEATLKKISFNPQLDMHIGPTGAWEFTKTPSAFAKVCAEYFAMRKEDPQNLLDGVSDLPIPS